MVPNFEGKLQVVWGKSVWIWGILKNCSAVGVSLLDFFFTTPVIQLPVLLVVGSGAINYLVQLGIKTIIDFWGTTGISQGINYISLYIFIIIIQIFIIQSKNFMSRIRGTKSGLRPQRLSWEISHLDFAFLWAIIGISFFSPIIEWGFNKFSGAFSLFTGWENFVVGYWCWFLILILLRLTAFLTEQRYKTKLLLMALVLILLSGNIGMEPQETARQIQFHKINQVGLRMHNFPKDQQRQIKSNLFTIDVMGQENKHQFEHDMRENYAITKIIYSQGAGRDWKSTICSTIKLETMSMELDGNFTQKLGHQQANRAVNKLDQQHSNLSQRTIHGVKSLQRPTQTFKPIRSQRLGGLRTLARTFSFYRTGGRSIHSRSSVNKQQRSSQAREWQGVTRLHDTTGQSLKALLLMLVTWEDQSTGTSGQTNWTAGVSPLTSKVSLCVMSRWGALSLVTVQEQMEEGHVAALMSRTHQMGALVNEDNPQNDRQEAVTATSGMTAGDSGIKRNTSSWGMYIYGAIILMGIMVHEHKEGSRCKGRHNSQVVYRLQHYTGRFFREWMALATLQVLVLMIGVALCVPSEVSPIGFVRQTAYRTLILGAIACVWIQAHLRSSMVWLKTHQAELQQRITVRLISGGTGDEVTGNRQSMRSGRGGRGSRTGSTPRGAGSGQRGAPMQRAAPVTPGAGGAHHYNNLGS